MLNILEVVTFLKRLIDFIKKDKKMKKGVDKGGSVWYYRQAPKKGGAAPRSRRE